MRGAIFWTLLPLVIPQAMLLRRRAPRFAPPPGEPRGSVGDGPPLRLQGIGDSIIAGVGTSAMDCSLGAQFAAALSGRHGRAVHWHALGSSGADTARIRAQLVPRLAPGTVDVFLVSTGVNDVTGLRRSRDFARELGALFDALRSHSPHAAIVMPGLPPLHCFPALPRPLRDLLALRGRQFDDIAATVAAARQGVHHVRLPFAPAPSDFAPDGFHPADAACSQIARLLASSIDIPGAA